jgi:hypothetical protein
MGIMIRNHDFYPDEILFLLPSFFCSVRSRFNLLPYFGCQVSISADKQWNTPATVITWTNKQPASRRARHPPEDILLTGRRLSPEALAATTPKEHWQCIITQAKLGNAVKNELGTFWPVF